MSQFWHAHWAEDSYKPGLLGNWQVPNWHPKWPCIRHCVTTTIVADESGRLLPDKPRSKISPWGDFKGTWELPLKIDRKLANKLSAPSKHKIAAWNAHKKHYEGPCGFTTNSKINNKKNINRDSRRKSPVRIAEKKNKPNPRSKSPKIEEKKTEIINKKKKISTKKFADKNKDKRNTTKDEDEKIFVEKLDDEETNLNEKEKNVIEEKNYKKEETVTKELKVAKKDKNIRRQSVKTECYCDDELDSHLKAEIISMPMKNICTIHQRLRV